MTEAPVLVPLDPNDLPDADGERQRAIETIRRKLAAGGMSPSRARLMRALLHELERRAA